MLDLDRSRTEKRIMKVVTFGNNEISMQLRYQHALITETWSNKILSSETITVIRLG